MAEKIKFKDLIGGLLNEDLKFLYWCWENKKCLDDIRLKARPGKVVLNANSSGDIKKHLIYAEKGGVDKSALLRPLDIIS